MMIILIGLGCLYILWVITCTINNCPDLFHYRKAYKALINPDCVLLSTDYEKYKEHGCWFFQSGNYHLAWSQKNKGFAITNADGDPIYKLCGKYPYLFDWYTFYWFNKIEKYLIKYKSEHKHPPFKNIYE